MKRDSSTGPTCESAERAGTLARCCAVQHTSLENSVLGWFATFRLLRRLGIDPLSWRGWVARLLLFVSLFLGGSRGVTWLTGDWAGAPVATWAAIGVGLGLVSGNYPLYQSAGWDSSTLYRTRVLDDGSMRRQIRWDRRWFNVWAAAPLGVVYAVAMVTSVFLTCTRASGPSVSTGSILLIGMLAYQIG